MLNKGVLIGICLFRVNRGGGYIVVHRWLMGYVTGDFMKKFPSAAMHKG